MSRNRRERLAYYIMGVAIGFMLLGMIKLSRTMQRQSAPPPPPAPAAPTPAAP